MMANREEVAATIRFVGPDQRAHDFPDPYGNDFAGTAMSPSPDGDVRRISAHQRRRRHVEIHLEYGMIEVNQRFCC